MSWKESKVRLLPPVSGVNPEITEERKPDINDLYLLANQAAALKAASLQPVPDSQNPLPDNSTGGTTVVTVGGLRHQLPLHPVKVEPGNSVINLPPPPPGVTSSGFKAHPYPQIVPHVTVASTSGTPIAAHQRLVADCAIMPPPPPPPPRTPTSPSTASVSSTSGEDSDHSTDIGKTRRTTKSFKKKRNGIFCCHYLKTCATLRQQQTQDIQQKVKFPTKKFCCGETAKSLAVWV